MKNQVINIENKFKLFDEVWTPKIIEQLNDYQLKIAYFHGEFTWHSHKETDEVFMVVEGQLQIEFRDRIEIINEGELFVVDKGVEHKPFAKERCKVLLIEPEGTINTGESESDLKASNKDWI